MSTLTSTRGAVAAVLLLAAGAAQQPASQPSSAPADRPAAGEGTGNPFLRGWLKELLDRDPPGARKDYDEALRRDDLGHEYRNLALARAAEIDALCAEPRVAQETRTSLRETGKDMGPDSPDFATVRAAFAALANAIADAASRPAAEPGLAELRQRVRQAAFLTNARPYLSRMLEPGQPRDGRGMRPGRGPDQRRGQPGPGQGNGMPGGDIAWQFFQRFFKSHAREIVRLRLASSDEEAVRLEGLVKEMLQQVNTRGFGSPALGKFRRYLTSSDPRNTAATLLADLEEQLAKEDARLDADTLKLLRDCRERGKELLEAGHPAKARDLLVWTMALWRTN